MKAIAGCGVTPFNMGDNEHGRVYDSIELILRDGRAYREVYGTCGQSA